MPVCASLLPPNTRTRPSPTVTLVGYQRSSESIGAGLNVPDAGSKKSLFLTPSPKRPACTCPPVMNTRPSGRSECPAQKMSRFQPRLTSVLPPEAGSQMRASLPTARTG
jgi:hypothetical protein